MISKDIKEHGQNKEEKGRRDDVEKMRAGKGNGAGDTVIVCD